MHTILNQIGSTAASIAPAAAVKAGPKLDQWNEWKELVESGACIDFLRVYVRERASEQANERESERERVVCALCVFVCCVGVCLRLLFEANCTRLVTRSFHCIS